jgi:hypothetical protein
MNTRCPTMYPDPLLHYDAPFLGLRHFDKNAARLFTGLPATCWSFSSSTGQRNTPDLSVRRERGGKSSFLAAGLPRLRNWPPVYTRRDKTHKNGLAGQLADLRNEQAPGQLPPGSYPRPGGRDVHRPAHGRAGDALINEIGHLLQQNQNATVVMGFRSDYYDQMNRWRLGVEV